VLFSAVNYRKKDAKTKPSVYVIHTRMAAQSIVIGSMILAMAHQLYTNHIRPSKND
jgi:hypothetical protein